MTSELKTETMIAMAEITRPPATTCVRMLVTRVRMLFVASQRREIPTLRRILEFGQQPWTTNVVRSMALMFPSLTQRRKPPALSAGPFTQRGAGKPARRVTPPTVDRS